MRYRLLLIGTLLPLWISAQNPRTISLQEAERLFLNQNQEMRAAKAEVDVAKADIRQAKLWNNPELTLEQINFWSDAEKRQGEKRSFAIGLAQEIRLGGKRKKEVQIARLNHHISRLQLALSEEEGLLRFRSIVVEQSYLTKYQSILQEELKVLQQITNTYRKQKELGFVSHSHYMRIQTAAFELEQEIIALKQQVHELEQLLHTAMGLALSDSLQIVCKADEQLLSTTLLANLSKQTRSHPLLQLQQKQLQFQQKSLALERVQRIPDLGLSASYDRRGGVWPNYFGVGLSIKLPLFNRNQGQIQAAQTLLELKKTELQTQETALTNQIQTALQQYQDLIQFEQKLKTELSYEDLRQIQASYTRNLLQKNISLIEFLDFLSAHRESLHIQLETTKNRQLHYFTLQYLVAQKTNPHEN